MLFELNGTFYIFIVSFLIFMWLLNEIMLKPVGRVIAERNALIEGDINSGKQAHGEADKLVTHYEDHLKQIRHEAQGIIHKATEEGNQARQQELAGVAARGRKKLEEAKANITAERASLIDALVAEEKELVETITRKVLGDESVNVDIDENQLRRRLEESR
jgi:F-type H+-transporting ATPase subunit b